MNSLAPGEFDPDTTYLNTASFGLAPARTVAALEEIIHNWAAGRGAPGDNHDEVDRLRAEFARLLPGATGDDVAVSNTVAALVGPIAAGLPSGAEVLVAEGDFASVINPFRYRGDLTVRAAPLERLAREVRGETALVAVSLTQSIDGRTVDAAELRAATKAHDALLLLDATQAAGWLPLRFADADFWVSATYKWLLGARSTSLMAINPEAAHAARPTAPGWYAAADRWAEMYAPQRLADTARRHDSTPDGLGVAATLIGLELIDTLTVESIGAHNRALARRFRTGLADLGIPAIPGDSPIVTIIDEDNRSTHLKSAGIVSTTRNGLLRFAFHLYNTTDDVDRTLKILSDN